MRALSGGVPSSQPAAFAVAPQDLDTSVLSFRLGLSQLGHCVQVSFCPSLPFVVGPAHLSVSLTEELLKLADLSLPLLLRGLGGFELLHRGPNPLHFSLKSDNLLIRLLVLLLCL